MVLKRKGLLLVWKSCNFQANQGKLGGNLKYKKGERMCKPSTLNSEQRMSVARYVRLRNIEISDNGYIRAMSEIAPILRQANAKAVALMINRLELVHRKTAINPKLVKCDWTTAEVQQMLSQY